MPNRLNGSENRRAEVIRRVVQQLLRSSNTSPNLVVVIGCCYQSLPSKPNEFLCLQDHALHVAFVPPSAFYFIQYIFGRKLALFMRHSYSKSSPFPKHEFRKEELYIPFKWTFAKVS